MSSQTITINIVVYNGERYVRHCLNAILTQTYPHQNIEINILDNNSTDKTREIIQEWASFGKLRIPKFSFVESKENLGMWPGQEELLKISNGKYILAMAIDVILDKNFLANAFKRMGSDDKIGGLEAKIYKFDLTPDGFFPSRIIDTCGFQIFKSRRVINIGHGQEDKDVSFAETSADIPLTNKALSNKSDDKQFNFNKYQEIFGVEGAAPFFRKEALENIRIKGKLIDDDFFWYGDDLDLAWRMKLFGWKEVFDPDVIAWHDRQTTKTLKKNFSDFIKLRRAIPIKKRRLDWRNTRWTIIKNDYIINILKDFPSMFKRELQMAIYILFFEPKILLEIPKFIAMIPKMLIKRREVMKRAIIKPDEINKWFS
ncbi:MAG: hypothetical protein COV30_02155 [Candidatus Yanofskybacteria bacterium CG10_big_fil_rev_8_21_14_0_10_37_15]|uniref:Glycosyltransferase 2-like domain-containing protein n=1 Tax=Candidatus Yanofskybacteria bacterium CG10_big_fil_rev_8_21_14_0_10_37_15 TaxID=1975097 RepID=A0A2H0R5F8_9BACT|nr:MAG: hypothetical protein COV30_02155 [Candidatus Yanofskybacteria bacterium CG10_big_fil_rev_8_21_14_0_10_37_15]